MYSNELLRTKIVGQTGERAILWQQRGAYLGDLAASHPCGRA
jgi:hypothetical protein